MTPNFLYDGVARLHDADLGEAEEIALAGTTLCHQLATRLLVEIRKLQHELNDPQYQYAGGRIHRHALVVRQVETSNLRAEVSQLKQKLALQTEPTESE